MEDNNKKEISSLEFQEIQILLSEKRTAHTTLRSGIKILVLPLTIISFLIATSSLYNIEENAAMMTFVIIGCAVVAFFGGYLIIRGLVRIRFHDRRIQHILENNKELTSIFYHRHETYKNNNTSKDYTHSHHDIVFHFDNSESELKIAISNIRNYFIALKDSKFTTVMVVNGPGIKLMGRDSEYAESLKELYEQGLSIRVCQNAINNFNIETTWLIPFCRVVPAGVIEIVNLQREGCVYLKP